ncbi:olfactory receptor 2AT4-like [Acipenser oxyrinchus oxyrinchus]|uniref:Olfactory receptor n=1 Tax=Acipenser oxyrinchus oxyrinchus TaxID=40147 RepID=A0AAD8G993_ACIOX|nr:olfactory receptor 2AT4-like [Acipenser oxyrinchus oxyrinchus]
MGMMAFVKEGQKQQAQKSYERMDNASVTVYQVEAFLLDGVPGLEEYQSALFAVFLLVYLVTFAGNLLILILVIRDRRLHTPMYFFLCNLSFVDIIIPTAIIPKLLAVLVANDKYISFAGCFVQMYAVLAFGSTEWFILLVMSFDRYVAIVKPLHYHVIINPGACVVLAGAAWGLGLLAPLLPIFIATKQPYCGSNKIVYCFCDYSSVVTLACADVTNAINIAFVFAMLVINISFFVVLWTYFRILTVTQKMAADDHRKAFSTCSSHLSVVVTYFLSTALVYIAVKIGTIPEYSRVIIGVFYYFLTPMLNPIIYTLRNEKIQLAAQKYLRLNLGLKAVFPQRVHSVTVF